MSDWKAYVRARLSAKGADPRREEEIVEELAQHPADVYRETLGASGSEVWPSYFSSRARTSAT